MTDDIDDRTTTPSFKYTDDATLSMIIDVFQLLASSPLIVNQAIKKRWRSAFGYTDEAIAHIRSTLNAALAEKNRRDLTR